MNPETTWPDLRGYARPGFARINGEWRVVGPARELPIGGEVTIYTRAGGKSLERIEEHLAERVVHHKDGSYTQTQAGLSTRYVIARTTRLRGTP